ncbi:sugar ABC transporter substrate-binding protein [Pseudonocardia tropica]|uniref:Sugar ABC transporter substrate-binding protein n=1 Tax=Pseudonocardia tropica TaxID=681289 RepID=A0ABV1JS44_9PSEU
MRSLVRLRAATARSAAAAIALVLAVALAGCSTTTTGSTAQAGPVAPEDIIMVSEVRSLTNPYEAAWVEGSKAYAESVGVELKTIVYNGDSQQALAQLQSVLATGRTVLLNINPNSTADTPAIVAAVKNAGGRVVTQWSKPDDLNPWDIGDSWVAYAGYDGVEQGRETGRVLAESMGGTGGVVALQGLLSNDISTERFNGLQEALSGAPGVRLLDAQPADFDRTKAYTTTKTLLSKYGREVTGIWAATDSMALGAIQAVSESGRTDVRIASSADATPEGLQAIEAGRMVATYTTDPYFNGAMGLALAYRAATGELDVAGLPESDRAFYVRQFLVTAENAAQYATPPTPEQIVESVRNPLERNAGRIS